MSEEIKKQPELTDEFLIRRYNEIYKEDRIWFILGSLISSENFWETGTWTSEEKFNELCQNYEYNISELERIAKIITSCSDIPVSDQKKIKKYAKDCAKLLKKEYGEVKENYTELHK